MHSVFNRTNNDNGIAAALLNGQLYRLGILSAVVVLIAALALVAGRRRLNKAYRLELDTNPGGVGAGTSTPQTAVAPQTAVGVGDDIVDVTTDQQEIPQCNTINRNHQHRRIRSRPTRPDCPRPAGLSCWSWLTATLWSCASARWPSGSATSQCGCSVTTAPSPAPSSRWPRAARSWSTLRTTATLTRPSTGMGCGWRTATTASPTRPKRRSR